MWSSKVEKHSFLEFPPPTLIHLSHRFISASKSAVSTTFAPGRASSATFERPWENFSNQLRTLYSTSTSRRKQETFIYAYPLNWVLLPNKTYTRTLLFGSKYSRHFDCWNQPLNMNMRVCYLDRHEAGLCCYLVIHCFTSICDLFTDCPSYLLRYNAV
jgi:hypothetical protein